MKHIVLIKNLLVNEASVHAGFYSSGLPAMTAVHGLVHALERKTRPLLPQGDGLFEEPGVLKVLRFCVGYSDFAESAGGPRRVNYQHGTTPGKAAPNAYDPLADFTAHLLLEVETSLSAEALKALLESHEMRGLVTGLRFAGGTISSGPLSALVTDSAVTALKAMPSATFVLEDAHPLMTAKMSEGKDAVQALAELLSRARVTDPELEVPYEPRYVPVAVGFLPLTALAPTQGLRADYPHCFVEPVVGAARIRLAASAAKNPDALLMWATSSTPGLFTLAATSI